MDVSTMLKTLARETPCPGCGAQRLEFLLRCDLDYGACLYTAHCRACEKTFEIVAGGARRPSEEILSEAVEPGAQCGSTKRVMHIALRAGDPELRADAGVPRLRHRRPRPLTEEFWIMVQEAP